MKAKEVREMSYGELSEKLISLKQELFNLRFSNSTRQLTDPSQISKCKKDIARVLTVMRALEIKNPAIKATLKDAALKEPSEKVRKG